VAVVRNSNTYTLYVNGTAEGTNSSRTTDVLGQNTGMKVGGLADGSLVWNGHIDEVRVSNSARYTANFTPSTTPFQNDSNTLLLIHADGTDASTAFFDDTGSRKQKGITAVGNAQVDTAQSKFGGASALFDGTDDSLQIVDNTWMNFGAGDFTAECWFRWSGGGDIVYPALITTWSENSSTRNFFLGINASANAPIFYFVNTAGTINTSIQSSTTISTNTWYHIAIVGNSSNFKLYLNGNEVSSLARQTIRAPAEVFRIGNSADNVLDFNGWIDEVRISNTARYTANFTPSTTPFQNDSNTLLLIHADGTDASTVFIDDNGTTPT
jgi:hypothetical protein